jgi:DNA-binding CsgD family transcriptional regulator
MSVLECTWSVSAEKGQLVSRGYRMIFRAKQWEYLRKCWHLTAREVEVAKLVCEGWDNNQIRKKLGVTYNTARAHLGNIFRKVGVGGKAGLILQFIEVLRKAKI